MTNTTARTAPRDRRAPFAVGRGACPVGGGCACCPKFTLKRNNRDNCALEHPPADRMCNPPWSENIPPCPERQTSQQDPPETKPGFWPLIAACCVECGRVTACRWTDPEGRVLPWCAGQIPDPEAKP